jgi:hypothetical protein
LVWLARPQEVCSLNLISRSDVISAHVIVQRARQEGDAANAILTAVGYNLRLLLAWLRILLRLFLLALWPAFVTPKPLRSDC